MLTFKVFDITSTKAVYQRTIEFDPECAKVYSTDQREFFSFKKIRSPIFIQKAIAKSSS